MLSHALKKPSVVVGPFCGSTGKNISGCKNHEEVRNWTQMKL